MTGLLKLTLVELSEALRQKKASPVELMEEVLARIDTVNGKLNALVVQRDDEVLMQEAREAESRLARGEGRPLEGIPLGVKDLEDVAGVVTCYGSKLFDGHVPQEDSTQVSRLKAAGAIVIGKTNAPEFGSNAITKNLIYGVTGSPWSNTEMSPGGSSGGSAAALSAEMIPLVTASDAGGSIRMPASFVGAFGHKPSFGRVPVGPMVRWEHNATLVYGPITKSVEDGAFFLDQVVGPDPRDPRSLPHPGFSYLEAVQKPPRKLKIAYSPDLGYAVVQPDVAAVVESAVRFFEKSGHSVTEIGAGPPDMGVDWGLLSAYEIGGHIEGFRPKRDDDISKALLYSIPPDKRGIDQKTWGRICNNRVALVDWCANLFSEYDLLVTPTVPYDPPPAKGPLPKETNGRQHTLTATAYFTIPFSLSWNPAATVRAGFSDEGFPVGMQLVGPQHRDDLVLRAARAFEREHYFAKSWPVFD